jgi:hypothetical protein
MELAKRRIFDLVVGLALGAVAGATYVSSRWHDNFATLFVIQTADQANVARRIAAGEGEALAAGIRAALPGYVQALQREFPKAPGRDWALWAVRDVYEQGGTPAPAELAGLLAALPPREQCPPPGGAPPEGPAPGTAPAVSAAPTGGTPAGAP